MNIFDKNVDVVVFDVQLLVDEVCYSFFGDIVYYVDLLKIFQCGEGSYMFDGVGVFYFDLQMWYLVCNFGYSNKCLNDVLKDQIDILLQVVSQYLYLICVQLVKIIVVDMYEKFGFDGCVYFNVGGVQVIEDLLKIVCNVCGGKSLMFVFEGGYYGCILGVLLIIFSYCYCCCYGYFGECVMFILFLYFFCCLKGMILDEYFDYCVWQFECLFESEYNGVWDFKVGQVEYVVFYVEFIQGIGGYVILLCNFFIGFKCVLDKYGILMVVDEIQMGFWCIGKLWLIEYFGVILDVLVFGKVLINGLNLLLGLWVCEELINLIVFLLGFIYFIFNFNLLGICLGLEVLKLGKEMDYECIVLEKGVYFFDGLCGLQKCYLEIGDVDGLGLVLCVEICQVDGYILNKELLDCMVDIGLVGGLLYDGKCMGFVFDVGGWYKNVIIFVLLLDISYEEIDLVIILFDQVLIKVKG